MANDFSLSVVGERDEFFEDFATIVEPPFEEEELEQREMRRNAFWREGDGTAEHGDAVVALGWAREVDDETAFFEQNGLFFGRRCRIERRLQERDDVFWLVIGSRNASQFVNRRLAHVIGFESLEIADIGEFFVSGVFEDAGDTELCKQDLLYDPQTAGGLLMAVDPADADALLVELRRCVPSAQRIGVVQEYQGGKRIFLK